MIITSTAFLDNDYIPSKYTCDDVNHSPPLTFSQVPVEAESLVLLVEDPDASTKVFTHWLVYNIPPSTLQLLENQVPPNSMQGITDFGKTGYMGPCPPSGTHRYIFKLFALDTQLDLQERATKEDVQKKMDGHVLEAAELIGLYTKELSQ